MNTKPLPQFLLLVGTALTLALSGCFRHVTNASYGSSQLPDSGHYPSLFRQGFPGIVLPYGKPTKDIYSGELILHADSNSLRYDFSQVANPDEIVTLNIPRTIEYKVVLSDNTTAWLNAESMFFFPLKFGKERKVRLVGEGAFIIAPSHGADTASLFQIDCFQYRISAYQAAININAYQDSLITVSVLKGQAFVEEDTARFEVNAGQDAIVGKGQYIIRPSDLPDMIQYHFSEAGDTFFIHQNGDTL